MQIVIDTKKLLPYVISFVLGFASGYYVFHDDSVTCTTTTTDDTVSVDVKDVSSTTVDYVSKTTDNRADVVDNTKSHLLVNVNSTEYEIPTDKVNENHKFENGQLVIEHENTYTVDLTKVTNELAKEKYSRVGKADFGVLYADNDLYAGIRYNAKAWDVGYYHSVDDNKSALMWHYKF